MARVRVAAGVVNQTPMDWDDNRQNLLAAIDAARRQGASSACRNCASPDTAAKMPSTARDCRRRHWPCSGEILPATQGMVVTLGLPLLHRHALFNCACLAVDGRIAGFVGKRFLCGDGLHYEPRWFKPWPQGSAMRSGSARANTPSAT